MGQILANLPTWLKIVGVLVIVLGILACGIGAARTAGEQDGPSSEPPQSDLSRFVPAGAVQASAISMGGSCSRSGNQFTGSGCVLTVPPQGGLLPGPLELRLNVSPGFATMTVTQNVRGRGGPRSTFLPTATTVAVPVAGTSSLTVQFSCSVACTLTVIER